MPQSTAPSSPTRPLAALRHAGFAGFLAARFLATFAVQMQTVAVGWQVYALRHDPLDLGLVGLSQFLPFIPLVLVAGHAADRFNRRKILATCYSVQVLCALLLLAFTLQGVRIVWPVFAIMILFGIARAFSMPSSQAIVPTLVPIESFGNAVALSSSSFQVATIVGPTLGGLLYLSGPQTVYAVVATLLALAAVLMSLARARPVKVAASPAAASAPADPAASKSWHAVLEGLRFVRSRPVVLGAISLDLFAVLLGGATALLPAYARDVLHVGPTGLGLLRTAPGVGAALAAAVLAFSPMVRHVGRWMFAGVALFGVATVIFGLSQYFVVSLCALLFLGIGDMASVYIRHMLVQLETPDAIRGRVSAVNGVFIGASNELGEFESGLTAAWFGLVPAVVIGGAATLVVAGIWMRWFPALRTIDRFPGH
ncbi:MAG TPA: MFS transporter [Steroidobacteraceae bacterium]|nr:MFS transporter [Steroidobacteraceae bacterium]